jgi:hypothetical protein
MVETHQRGQSKGVNNGRRMFAFGLVVVGLNGLALSGLLVLSTRAGLLQTVGAFVASLFFLIVGVFQLARQPARNGAIVSATSGMARALVASVMVGVLIVAIGVGTSYWIGPSDAEFLHLENTRNAAFAACQQLQDGHIVDDVCRDREGEYQFRLPPAPIDWTIDEEGG